MKTLPNHTALKEWQSVIAALGRGDQIILIRKGGIADAGFAVEANRFYLFPTKFHESGGQAPSPVQVVPSPLMGEGDRGGAAVAHKTGRPVGAICPDCGQASVAYGEGCMTCQECGWSQC